ncbi:MAG: hypothetical protein KDD94_08435 [Calditrichaeota bacterium]|nr:hypothetical protein [Calditrichota bacterium]
MNFDDIKTIRFGKGLGKIEFGMSKSELRSLLGEPDEIESDDDSDDETTVNWHYDQHELSITLMEVEDWIVVMIAVSSPKFLLNGQPLIGKSKDDVMATIEKLGKTKSEDLSSDDIPDYTVESVEKIGANFWFEGGMLSEIQWSPLWDEDELFNMN